MINKLKYIAIVLLSCTLLLQGYFILEGISEEKHQSERKKEDTTIVKKEETKPTKKEYEANLVTVGDILVHDRVYNDFETGEGTYDFTPAFAHVKKYIEQADIAMTNVETMIGGVEIGLSGYPKFNSPYEIGDVLKDTGFDIVTLANNHTYDRGEVAIDNALNYWDKLGMINTGVSRNETERSAIKTITKNNITFSFLAYTYGTNGLSLPSSSTYEVNMLDKEQMKKDIAKAKEISDVIVVAPHFGDEYQKVPSEEQKELAQFLADEGVHIVAGSHPHVLQAPTFLEGKDGNQTYVMYSLGNFFSGQYGIDRRIGGIFGISVQKTIDVDGSKTITLKEPTLIPTYVAYEYDQNYEIYPIDEIPLERLENSDYIYAQVMEKMQENTSLQKQ
ncbi:MAG: CapA family protein [Bacillaceae bacterium]